MIMGISRALSKGFRKRKWRRPVDRVGICLAENFTTEDFHSDFIFRLSLKLGFLPRNPRLCRIYEENSYLSPYREISVYLILERCVGCYNANNK